MYRHDIIADNIHVSIKVEIKLTLYSVFVFLEKSTAPYFRAFVIATAPPPPFFDPIQFTAAAPWGRFAVGTQPLTKYPHGEGCYNEPICFVETYRMRIYFLLFTLRDCLREWLHVHASCTISLHVN